MHLVWKLLFRTKVRTHRNMWQMSPVFNNIIKSLTSNSGWYCNVRYSTHWLWIQILILNAEACYVLLLGKLVFHVNFARLLVRSSLKQLATRSVNWRNISVLCWSVPLFSPYLNKQSNNEQVFLMPQYCLVTSIIKVYLLMFCNVTIFIKIMLYVLRNKSLFLVCSCKFRCCYLKKTARLFGVRIINWEGCTCELMNTGRIRWTNVKGVYAYSYWRRLFTTTKCLHNAQTLFN